MSIASFIRKSTVDNKEEYFADKYKVFRAKYPMLYKQICTDDEFDMSNLQYMLDVIDNKKDAYTADVHVGQMLFDKYVKHLDTPPNTKK